MLTRRLFVALCISFTAANGCASWQKTPFLTEPDPTRISRARVRTLSDSTFILRDVVITRDSLKGIAESGSTLSMPIRNLYSVEVRRLNEKRIVWYAFAAVITYQILRIVFMYLAYSTEAT